MKNQEIVEVLYEIADFLEMDNTSFKSIAYKKAALTIENLEEKIEFLYKKGGTKELEKIKGVGEHIALQIEEYIKKGKIEYLEKLKKKYPVNIKELVKIEGLGPKTIKTLYQELKITNIKELEKATKEHKIAFLFGFGEKTEENILEGINFFKQTKEIFLLGNILPVAENIYHYLENFPEVKIVSLAGSLRRKKEIIKDIDLIVVSDKPLNVINHFLSMKGIIKVIAKGKTKVSVKMKEGFNVDIRIVSKNSYGSALQHFTGSKEHNISLRKIAIEKGFKVNEYGVFKKNKSVAGKTEEEVYHALGMQWIPPELREDQGEIELALKRKLPNLVEYDQILGDLHCHSTWSGGNNSIKEIADRAIEMGYQYIGISDHTKFLKIENGLDEKQLIAQRKEIDKINNDFLKTGINFKILQGCEANILSDGAIDINHKTLSNLDFVIAGIHSHFKMSKNKMTQRIIKAMENPNVDIISHLTGRILKKRSEYEIDFDKLIEVAKRTKIILEINSYPERLDLKDSHIRKAKDYGVKMIINSDAHHREHMKSINLGIAQARRGWAEKEDIINTFSFDKLLNFLK